MTDSIVLEEEKRSEHTVAGVELNAAVKTCLCSNVSGVSPPCCPDRAAEVRAGCQCLTPFFLCHLSYSVTYVHIMASIEKPYIRFTWHLCSGCSWKSVVIRE